jgi:hypothetical protein
MMLGGVGFQSGLDRARREQAAARDHGTDVVERLQGLKALLDDGVLTPEEFQRAKRKVLGD